MVTGLGTTINTRQPIQVTDADADTWQRAFMRGQENSLAVKLVHVAGDGEREQRLYHVQSRTRPGMSHSVIVETVAGEDAPTVVCGCEAGEFMTICQHAALALHEARSYPFPIHEQTVIELPAVPDPQEWLCGCHGKPAVQVHYTNELGWRGVRWACPIDGLVVGPSRREDWERRQREKAVGITCRGCGRALDNTDICGYCDRRVDVERRAS